MEKMINLRDLLVHEIQDLYSVEEQIIEALPAMIEKAGNKALKKALQDHLKVTGQQKERLDEVKRALGEDSEEGQEGSNGNKKGFFSNLFGGKGHHCRGMEGLIEEGEKVMAEDMTPEVLDAAIIACAQKIEHYEICGYGTARAYARELDLGQVAELLEETLNEEYEADDLLTDLAVGRLNEEAEKGEGEEGRRNGRSQSSGSRSRSGASSNGKSNGSASKSSSRGGSSKGAKSSSSKSASSRGSSGGSKAGKSAASGRGGGRKAATASRSKSSAGKSRSARAKSK